ncbi:hypothetical protein [Alicyclobacillus macrosporangiidus]|nr:hypothetical protein [Alicyclobacillus macrosporangiidus]
MEAGVIGARAVGYRERVGVAPGVVGVGTGLAGAARWSCCED